MDHSFDELTNEFVHRFDESVRSHLDADVPIGAFLSGGVDSSAIVASMAQDSNRELLTCTIGFKESDYDESSYAEEIASQYQTDHRVHIVSSDDFDLSRKLIEVFDEPFADSSALPTYSLCEATRENVTVAISGDGSDELLAGYRRHRLHMVEEKG